MAAHDVHRESTNTAPKVVTRQDLAILRRIRKEGDRSPEADALLDRLIAAAEADAPPLPEGWVLHSEGGHRHPYYHERGHIYASADVDGGCLHVSRVGE